MMKDFLTRARAQMQGRLANSRAVSELVAVGLHGMSLMPGISEARRLGAMATACRRTSAPWLRARLSSQIQPRLTGSGASQWRDLQVGWGPYLGDLGRHQPNELITTLILKAPNGTEKGILYSSFEYNWLKLAAHPKARQIFEKYLLIGASSWSPGNFGVMASLAGLSEDPMFIGISNDEDMKGYALLRPTIEPLPLLASDWINPAYYEPKPPSERSIDILMVANFLPFKRHWMLFEALRQMPRNLRVVLIGIAAPGRTEQTIRDEARSFGVQQELVIKSNLDIDAVTRHQCDARIAVIFSRREGSCVVVAESLFAGTPVAMDREAHIGSRRYINEQTGILTDRHRLAFQLTELLERASSMNPRQWAVENISCWESSKRLNQFLREYSRANGRPWQEDAADLCWRHMPRHARPEDEARLRPAKLDFEKEFGIRLL